MLDLPDHDEGGEASSQPLESITIGHIQLERVNSTDPTHVDRLSRLAGGLYEQDAVGIPGIDGFYTPGRVQAFIEDGERRGNSLFVMRSGELMFGCVSLVHPNKEPDQIVLRVLDGYEGRCIREALQGVLWLIFEQLGRQAADLFALKRVEAAVAREFGMKLAVYDQQRGYERYHLNAEQRNQWLAAQNPKT